MIRINQIKLPLDYTEELLKAKVCKILKVKPEEILSLRIAKRSVDARKKPDIFYTVTAEAALEREEQQLKRAKNAQISLFKKETYKFPQSGMKPLKERPVIIGSGPAGLFCAYFLAANGYRPIILERGQDVDSRKKVVEDFWRTGRLNTASNVQFGEGGAGTFSDGKLNTLVKDKDGRNHMVLSVFVEHGAPERILYENKPHIGTDILINVVRNMRKKIEENGGEFRFCHQVTDFTLDNRGSLQSLVVSTQEQSTYSIAAQCAVLAIGHSARDTFALLEKKGISMEAKSFAVGFRVEHPQSMINLSQYGKAKHPLLPAAAYKLTAQTASGRGVYSFCMCPGGFVVNASSEEGRLAVNGMSYSDRGANNANSAIIVSVTPEDYGTTGPLAGVYFQQQIEERAFRAGNGSIPIQRYGNFKKEVLSKGSSVTSLPADFANTAIPESFSPCIKGAYKEADVSAILPQELNEAFIEGMEQFGKKIKGFADGNVWIDGIESRTSSPVRIHRNESCQSNVYGLYPCGEGAGYAGGITSAAMDGMKIAETIASDYKPVYNILN